MGILQEDQELGRPGGDLELVDWTESSSSSNGADSSLGRIEEVNSDDHADGLWSDQVSNRPLESYYTLGDRIRFGFLFVLMITLVVTISAKVGTRNKEENTTNAVAEPFTTASPTVTPYPTPIPTTSPAPTVDPLRAHEIANFINSLTLTQRVLAYPSEASTEEKALKWVIEDDPAQRRYPDEAVSIRERYVLACLWFQSDVPFTDYEFEGFLFGGNYTSTWMTKHYECEWTGISCTEFDDAEGYGTDGITSVFLYNSSVHGVLSPDIALLQALVHLRLHVNSIESPVPQTLANLPALETLDLGDNLFSEPVPPMIAYIQSLHYLSLAGNDFTGSIPVAYENLVNLTDLLLYNNSRMDGQIPDFSQSGKLSQLLLYNNSFSGTLPESYFYMEELDSFDVSGNYNLGGSVAPQKRTNEPFSPFQKMNMHSTNLTGSLEYICDSIDPNDGTNGTKEFSADIDQVDCSCCHFFCPWTNETEWAPAVGCEDE